MASKDSPSEQARNIEEAQEDDGEVEVPEEYKWLQEQLSAAMRVGAGEGEDEEAEGWQDPSGGILPHMLEVSEEGDAEKLEQLIAQLPADADINTHGPDGDTCLHVACLYGHQACVELLLAKGADANAVNSEDGSTALHDAAAGGYTGICQLLLERVNTQALSAVDEDGDTVLHHAARGDHLEVVKMLVEKGASAKARNRDDNTPREESDDPEVKDFLQALE